MDIINNNPYRLLGVFANSPIRERVANVGKLKAFLRVGRQVTFPLDLTQYLPPLTRTVNTPTDAVAKLTLPADQIRYAQFWFIKSSPLDNVAFNHLFAGDMDKAIEIWNKRDDASSLQNRIICSLIRNDTRTACTLAELLYHNFVAQFVEEILGKGSSTPNDLEFKFLDVLSDEVGSKAIMNSITDSNWKKHIASKSISPIISRLQSAIDTAKASRDKGPIARYNAGVKLMNSTKGDLALLKTFLSTKDLQYQMIADKLGQEILQCGIDYFNNSDEQDAAQKSIVLQKYALSIVVGQMAKDRCQENVDILKNIIASLPPQEVFAEDKAIKDLIVGFKKRTSIISSAISLLNDTRHYLQSIKTKLGKDNLYYLRTSTQIVNLALGVVIDFVNNEQAKLNYSGNSSFTNIENFKSALRMAWNATNIMDKFDMDNDFKTKRYTPNRDILERMCFEFDIFVQGPPPPGPWLSRNYQYVAAFILMLISFLCGVLLDSNSPSDSDKICMWIGIGLGVIAWTYPFIDNTENGGGEALGCLGDFGCLGIVIIFPLFIHYWIYKGIAWCVRAISNKQVDKD